MRTLPSKAALSKLSEYQKLRQLNQEHVFEYWHELTLESKQNLLNQVRSLDGALFESQRAKVLYPEKHDFKAEPFKKYFPEEQEDHQLGLRKINKAQVALIVLAGGQGSRLQCDGPKGCVSVTAFKKKSLFQLLAEKVVAASKRAGRPLEMAIMTSPLNHDQTLSFFKENHYFGLRKEHLHFLPQEMLPLLDFEGNLFLEKKDSIACGPNGNGGIFRTLTKTGLWLKWKALGVECVQVIPIDNPLALPFDCGLIGFHFRSLNEITLKTAFRRNAEESVGLLAEVNGKAAVMEYSELGDEQKRAREADGYLKFAVANLGIYCFSMSFMQKAAHFTMPLHAAKKAVKTLEAAQQSGLNGYKLEEFIFDSFSLSQKISAVLCERSLCFAPLKNLHGEDSMETVREALFNFDRTIFEKVSGQKLSQETLFELAPQFYYPTQALIEKWKGRALLAKGYIDE